MTYTETDNIIQIDGALPTTDKTGTVQLKLGSILILIFQVPLLEM